MFLGKGVIKICCKFTGDQPCQSLISIKLQSNFSEVTLRHGCTPVNLLHIFRKPFLKNTSGRLLLVDQIIFSYPTLYCYTVWWNEEALPFCIWLKYRAVHWFWRSWWSFSSILLLKAKMYLVFLHFSWEEWQLKFCYFATNDIATVHILPIF